MWCDALGVRTSPVASFAGGDAGCGRPRKLFETHFCVRYARLQARSSAPWIVACWDSLDRWTQLSSCRAFCNVATGVLCRPSLPHCPRKSAPAFLDLKDWGVGQGTRLSPKRTSEYTRVRFAVRRSAALLIHMRPPCVHGPASSAKGASGMRVGHRTLQQRVAIAVVPAQRAKLALVPSELRPRSCATSAMPGASLDAANGESSHSERAWAYWRSLGSPKYHVAPMVDQVRPCSPPSLQPSCKWHSVSRHFVGYRAPQTIQCCLRLSLPCRSRNCLSACCAEPTAQRRRIHRCCTPASSRKWRNTGPSTSPAAQKRTSAPPQAREFVMTLFT